MTFRPASFQALKTYDRQSFAADLVSGLTVGVIALPLAIGFGIASGVTPTQGLWTAIVAGFLISLLGGSRLQIGGPTGAFVPVLALIVAQHGYTGLALATIMAGMMLIVMGALKLGSLIKFIPYPVTAGFTSGIAVIILVGQLNEFAGLGLKMPEHVPQQLMLIGSHLSQTSLPALGIGLLTIAIVFGFPKITTKVPPSIVAVIVCTALVHWFELPVNTIVSKFGSIPSGWPGWHLPPVSLDLMRELMGPALTIAALGAIESLLSAMVADGMADTRHDSNQELIGQGIANVVTPLIGGIAATGAIARTAANIRNGARSPVSGMVHALVLLLVALFAAPMAGMIPLACLSGILITVALRMAEWDTFPEIWRSTRSDFFVLLTAFLLTVIFDLTIGVGIGLIMAAVMFVKRMEEITHIKLVTPVNDDERSGSNSIAGKEVPEGVVLYRVEGPFFFAAAEKLESTLRASGGKPRAIILRMRNVPAMDASGLHALEVVIEKLHRDGVKILLTGVQPQPMKVLVGSTLAEKIGLDHFCADIDEALVRVRMLG
ncbi:MAG: sulfate permease [Verrucomicrobiaceae bacterium]|nr:sulfate permease [Verrucomicrobiaceae bacterium]